MCLQVSYCILHNGRMCSALEGRYLGIRARCLRLADMLSALSYEAQAPLKVRPTSLGRERACESVNAYMQVQLAPLPPNPTRCIKHEGSSAGLTIVCPAAQVCVWCVRKQTVALVV